MAKKSEVSQEKQEKNVETKHSTIIIEPYYEEGVLKYKETPIT